MAAPKRVPVPPAKPKRVPVPPARPADPAGAAPAAASGAAGRPSAAAAPPAPKPAPRPPITKDSKLRVLVAGASGMIGRELTHQLAAAGHTVLTLVRRPPQTPAEFTWAPDAKILDFRLLDDVDAVINLSGASLSRLPWTAGWRTQILRSRVKATQALVEAMSMAARPPQVFLSGSAVGYYGSRPGEVLTEESPRGTGFLSDVVEQWEAAARLAPEATRTVLLRSGVVLGHDGALKPLRLLTRLGISGPLGTGRQQWAWIGLHDEAAAIVHLLTSDLAGPVNLVAPEPATAGEIGGELARSLHRPFAFAVPRKVLELALQDAGRDLLLADQLVRPERLLADGFRFRHPTSAEALAALSPEAPAAARA